MLLTADRDPPPCSDALDQSIAKTAHALLSAQRRDGHFVFELEADVSISAEYILFIHHRGAVPPPALAEKFARYFRARQTAEDGWPLLEAGPFDISSSVKAYFALKLLGDRADAAHMARARAAILRHGGAARANVSTRGLLALYGAVPWTAVPMMPVEIMLLPKWFPFHLDKVSFWARTMITPMLVVNALRPRAKNPGEVDIRELFPIPAEQVRQWPGGTGESPFWTPVFAGLDKLLRLAEPFFPKRPRRRAMEAAEAFVTKRLNGVDGLGAIYPAMAYSVIMYEALGRAPGDPLVDQALESIERLVVEHVDDAYVQPCVSPVWDTGLAALALMEVDHAGNADAVRRGLDWLRPRQILNVKGDWATQKPDLRPGGWAFQYNSDHYPDLDDTAVVVMAMDRARRGPSGSSAYDMAIERGREWLVGLQSRNGGWGAYVADNVHEYLNNIPFADHGALLDPPTADVTARAVSMLAQLGETPDSSPAMRRGIDFLMKVQETDGSWFGRWGLNYVYGTWSVLCALDAAGVDPRSEAVRRAVAWLKAVQNPDGGWGEDGASYARDRIGHRAAASTASQTAWALIGLMAAGDVDDPAVRRGVDHLLATQGADGFWDERRFTATGFPRVLYLRYHGYAKYFPLWALARFRNRDRANDRHAFGM